MAALASTASSSAAALSSAASCPPPDVTQPYTVLSNTQISPDSNLLEVSLEGRDLLGFERDIPTCVAVAYTEPNYDNDDDDKKDDKDKKESVLMKSYSPVSHPNMPNKFELLVKAYEPRPGGGVGAYICGLQAGDVMKAKVKKQRMMHGSPTVLGRWNHVGLVAGGTGIAPLYQIAKIILEEKEKEGEKEEKEEEDEGGDNKDEGGKTKIHVLSINRTEQDILLRKEMDALAKLYPGRFVVHYSLTGQDEQDKEGFLRGRGSVEMIHKTLPDPKEDKVMVLVCGKTGFVSNWGGPIGRAPPLPDGSKGPKIQGPLLGLLKDAGFDESQVFKY